MKYRTALRQSVSFNGPGVEWKLYRRGEISISISYVMGILNAILSIFASGWLEWALILAAVCFGYLAFHVEARIRQDYARIHRCDENCR
jgi:hypothetical protein